jgi:hypothetical protein
MGAVQRTNGPMNMPYAGALSLHMRGGVITDKPRGPIRMPRNQELEPMGRGQRVSARPHGPTYMTRGAPIGGCARFLL